MKGKRLFLVVLVFCTFIFSSCLSLLVYEATEKEKDQKPKNDMEDVKTYIASGENESLLKAINSAKISAIKKGVVDLIGVYGEQQNEEKLRETLYSTKNPNVFVVNEKMEVLQKYKISENYFCEIKIPVKLKALSDFLEDKGIYADKNIPLPENNFVENGEEKTRDPKEILAAEKKRAEEAGNAEYLDHYLDTMTYMVFGAEDSSTDPFLLKSAVEMANAYLISHGNTVVDFAEIEKLKKENAQVYQESQSTGVSLIQWIAQRLNADVYLEIDASTEGGYNYDGSYYGSAKVTVKIFNPSTGEILGSVPYSSPKTYSRVSAYDAESNALQSTIYKVLPIVRDQSKLMLAKAYARGIRYELIINGTDNARLMSLFRKELQREVNDMRTLSLSSNQARYAVFAFCEVDEILSIVYNVSENLPGFENMELVMLRGKSLTFTMGN